MKTRDIKKLYSRFRNIPVDEKFLRDLRQKLELQTSLDIRSSLATVPAFSFRRIASATALATVLLGSAGTVFASQVSLPGETLYPIKRLVENVKLVATVDEKAKANVRLNIAKERLTEINSLLAEKHDSNTSSTPEFEDNIKEAASNFDSQIKQVSQNADKLEEAGELEKALQITTNIYNSGEHYKNLIQKSQEDSVQQSEQIKNRMDDSSKETEIVTEKAKKQIERIKEKNEKIIEQKKIDEEKSKPEEKESSIPKESSEASILKSYNINREEKKPTSTVSEPPIVPIIPQIPSLLEQKVEDKTPELQKSALEQAQHEAEQRLEAQRHEQEKSTSTQTKIEQ